MIIININVSSKQFLCDDFALKVCMRGREQAQGNGMMGMLIFPTLNFKQH